MRMAIRQQLINQIPDIRAYEPHAPRADTQKPYLVIKQGVETEESEWSGFRRIIEVWPYVEHTQFSNVDDLATKVIAALENQLLTDSSTGEVFSCQYLGAAGPDFMDNEWQAITRGLRFAVMALQPVAVQETVANDTWIEALATWTEQLLGTGWTVYRHRWPMGYVRPSVLWRLATWRIEGLTRSGYRVQKNVVGHVVGSTPNQQTQAVGDILERLMSDIKIPLDAVARTYLTVGQSRGDGRVDEFSQGQINLQLSRNTSRPKYDLPVMQVVDGSGNWR